MKDGPYLVQQQLSKAIKTVNKLPIQITLIAVGLIILREKSCKFEYACFVLDGGREDLARSKSDTWEVHWVRKWEVDAKFKDAAFVGTLVDEEDAIPTSCDVER